MTIVYGGCIEPGGIELDDETVSVKCPVCQGNAVQRYWESCDGGSINRYSTFACSDCGHLDGDLPDFCFDDG